jgi:lactoylglutathione lyase
LDSLIKLAHIAIWSKDIEVLKNFYVTYFGGFSNERYENRRKQFSSYFIEFDGGSRLEIMQRPDITSTSKPDEAVEQLGLTHLAFSLGTETAVQDLTKKLIIDGYKCVSDPRRTGDGYFESVVLDPEGNRVEISS